MTSEKARMRVRTDAPEGAVKFICDRAHECNDEACPHAQPHDGCDHTCQRVADARCVMDVMSLPEVEDMGTVAIMIPRRREKA